MRKNLPGKALVAFEAKRDVCREVLDGVREIKASGGKRTNVEAKSYVVCARFTTELSSDTNSYSDSRSCASRTGPLHHSRFRGHSTGALGCKE